MSGHGKTLLLRADAGTRMGTGHVMRCLALAQAWRAAGGTCRFVAAGLPAALEKRVGEEGFAVELLETDPGSDEDAARTVRIARDLRAEWVALDGYHFFDPYQHALKEGGLRVLAFDDHGHARHRHANLVLNQNLGAKEDAYPARGPSTRLLLGIRYALLRREFLAYRDWHREVPEVGRKVLVTLGGSDPDNVTLRAIRAMGLLAGDGREAVVIVGGSNPHRAALEGTARECPAKVSLRVDATDMPAWMAWADVAIGAGGATTWERALLGLPSLLLVLADNQAAIADAVQAAGLGWNLGWHEAVTEGCLSAALGRLLASRGDRRGMAERARAAVDGRGAERVAGALLAPGAET